MKRKLLNLTLALIGFMATPAITEAQCAANFSFTAGPGGLIYFTSTSTGTSMNTFYSWNFGEPNSNYNGASGQTPSHLYGSNGTYTVMLAISDGTMMGCSSTYTAAVNVSNSPCNLPINAAFTNTMSMGSVTFASTSTGTTGTASYAWTYGDGNNGTGTNPTHTYAVGGWYAVKLKVTDGGCKDSVTNNVNVCFGEASFTYSQAGGNVTFSSTSTGTNGLTGFGWNFGDGNTGTGSVTSHQYTNNGTYYVGLNLTNVMNNNYTMCPTYTNMAVVVNTGTCNALAGLTYSVNPGGVVDFTSTSTGTVVGSTYSWNFGDGTTGTGLTTSHTYSNGGTHTISLNVTNAPGCFDGIGDLVNVNTIPCVANSNFSLTYSGTPLLWYATPSYPWNLSCLNWNMGDGTFYTCTPYPVHTYSAAGMYNVCLNVYSACGTSSTCTGYNVYRSAENQAMITLSVVPYSVFVTSLKKFTEENATVGVYPTPNNGKLNLHVSGIHSVKPVSVEVLDIVGKVVYTESVAPVVGTVDKTLDLQHLSTGSYFVKIKTEEKTYTAKTVISK